MQHLAGLLADSLSGMSVPPLLAAACRAHVPYAISIRLAVWVQEDVLAATGNLAAEGDLALRLLPGCSAAGRCAATAAPYLVDGHRVHETGPECSGACRCTLYLPISRQLDACGSTAGQVLPQPACGCLLVGFCCAQTDAIHRSTGVLAALAEALADVLPGAAEKLRQGLSIVVAAEAPAAQAPDAVQPRLPGTDGGRTFSSDPAGPLYEAALVPATPTGGTARCLGHGSDSEASSGDSIGAMAGSSDTEPEPFLEMNFCASDMQRGLSHSSMDTSAAVACSSPLTPCSPHDTGDSSHSSIDTSAATVNPLLTPPSQAATATEMPPLSPRYHAGISEAGGDSDSDDSRGALSSRRDSGSSQGVDEDVAALKAALHDSPTQPAAPPSAQPLSSVSEAAFLRWHAASSYKLDVAALALLLVNILSKGARPPAWLFWTLPSPSLTFVAVNTVCLLLALLSPSWRKQREAAMLAYWGALVFISVSYMRQAPTLEYSEPGALAKPLWVARAFGLETTMIGPVAMRLRFGLAAPVVLLHSAGAAAAAPHVCGAAAFAGVSLCTCTAAAWTAQAVFCLALPLLLAWWLDARSRRQFWLQARPAARRTLSSS